MCKKQKHFILKEKLSEKEIALNIFKEKMYIAFTKDSIINSFQILIKLHMEHDLHYFDDKVACVEFYSESRMLCNGYPVFFSGRFLTQLELDNILVYLHQIEDVVNTIDDNL